MSDLRRSEDDAVWWAWRLTGLTATDLADAYCGTYGGAYAVVARKLGLVERGDQTDVMSRGHRWQPAIADTVHALTGYFVVGEEHNATHATDARWLATIDGYLAHSAQAKLAEVVAVLEAKTRSVHVHSNRARHECQMQWQMLVTGLSTAVLAEAVIDDVHDVCVRVDLAVVEADPFMQAELLELAESLWAHIQAGTLPDADSPSALDVAKELNAEVDDAADTADLSDLTEELERFHDMKARVKVVEAELKEIEARLRQRVGAASKGSAPGWSVSVSKPALVITAEAETELMARFPEHVKRSLDRDACKKAHKAEYEAARSPQGARKVTVRPTQGES